MMTRRLSLTGTNTSRNQTSSVFAGSMLNVLSLAGRTAGTGKGLLVCTGTALKITNECSQACSIPMLLMRTWCMIVSPVSLVVREGDENLKITAGRRRLCETHPVMTAMAVMTAAKAAIAERTSVHTSMPRLYKEVTR